MGETTIIDRGATSARITCPSCAMEASAADHRHLRPLVGERGGDLRCCRNCGERFALDERGTRTASGTRRSAARRGSG